MIRGLLSLLVALLLGLPVQAKEHELLSALGLKKGMDREAVVKILGEPKQTKRDNMCWGMEERWWYDRKELTQKVLLFTDGKLDVIEPAKTTEPKGVP